MSRSESTILSLERELMGGSVQWVADFTESCRNVRIGETIFDVVLKGDIKPKGLLVARIIGFLLVPNYYVAAFVLRISDQSLTPDKLRVLIDTARSYMKEDELKWSWLIVVDNGKPSRQVLQMIQELNLSDVGVVVLEESSGEFHATSGLLGEHLRKCVGKALKEAEKYRPTYPGPGKISPLNASKLVFLSSSIFLFIFLGMAFLTGLFPMILSPVIVAASAAIGLFLYYSRMHLSFVYDLRTFLLKRGRTVVLRGDWSSVKDVSIGRKGLNDFYLELKPKTESLPGRIPASTLKIDPFPLRLALLNLLRKEGA